jgi:GTPase-associated protein 1, N-terminal domain type 1/Effector-associated domain 1
MPPMILQQAYFGEERGGHALLAASERGRFAEDLASRLDLPDTAPRGVAWSPFLRGFPVENFYVLARTAPDHGASRAGMVFAHAVILRLDDAMRLDNLVPLLRLLKIERTRNEPLGSIEFTPNPPEIESAAPELYPIVTGLLGRREPPVVLLGQEGFDQRIAQLWAHLWPAMRRGFAFRLSFSPQDLVDDTRPAVVCTPEALAARWSGFTLVEPTASGAQPSLAAAVLVGDEAGWPLRAFANDIETEIDSFRDLHLLERAFELAHAPTDRAEQLIAAARLIEHLSPVSTTGAVGKEPLLERLAQSLRSAAPGEVLQLRNLQLASFSNATLVWTALECWTAQTAWSKIDDVNSMDVVADGTKLATSPSTWQRAVQLGLATALGRPEAGLWEAVWRWAMVRPVVVASLFAALPDERYDLPLSKAVPIHMPNDMADQILPQLIENRWLYTHATVAAAAYPPLEAVRRQLAVESNAPLERISLAIRGASLSQLLTIAVQLKDERLIELAGSAVASHPTLLGSLDFGEIVEQRIWALALRVNPGVWKYPPDSPIVVISLMTSLIDGHFVAPELIDTLSRTPLAAIEEFSRRSELWRHLPAGSRGRFLAATADAWLNRFAEGLALQAPEPELEQAILQSSQINSLLETCIPGRIAVGARLFLAVPISDQRFIQWVRAILDRVRLLGDDTAELLGRVVLQRNSHFAASEFVRLYSRRTDLRPALRLCYHLLSLWDRLRLHIVPLTEEDKWQLFEDTAVNLYEQGPDEGDLWSRAGGHNADLLRNATARVRWHDAVRRMRAGAGTTQERLLDTMLEDYPRNDELQFLAEDLRAGRKGRQR